MCRHNSIPAWRFEETVPDLKSCQTPSNLSELNRATGEQLRTMFTKTTISPLDLHPYHTASSYQFIWENVPYFCNVWTSSAWFGRLCMRSPRSVFKFLFFLFLGMHSFPAVREERTYPPLYMRSSPNWACLCDYYKQLSGTSGTCTRLQFLFNSSFIQAIANASLFHRLLALQIRLVQRPYSSLAGCHSRANCWRQEKQWFAFTFASWCLPFFRLSSIWTAYQRIVPEGTEN